MKELELKHLAGYLPYGLSIIRSSHGDIETLTGLNSGVVMINHDTRGWADFSDIKPIMHPLSDLTKPIDVNGETFVPIIELAKLFFENTSSYEVTHFEHPRYNHGYLVNCCYENDSNRYAYFFIKNDILKNSYEIVQKLQEWHFWIYDQSAFENGLVIDINTLNK